MQLSKDAQGREIRKSIKRLKSQGWKFERLNGAGHPYNICNDMPDISLYYAICYKGEYLHGQYLKVYAATDVPAHYVQSTGMKDGYYTLEDD